MKNFEALHHSTTKVETISQAHDILDSVDALASQALIKSKNLLEKARRNNGYEVAAPVVIADNDKNIFPSWD